MRPAPAAAAAAARPSAVAQVPASTLLFAAGAAAGRARKADALRALLINRVAEDAARALKPSRRARLADFVIDAAFEAVPPGGAIGATTVAELEAAAQRRAREIAAEPPTPPRGLAGALARGAREREDRRAAALRAERKRALASVAAAGVSEPPSMQRLRLELFEAARAQNRRLQAALAEERARAAQLDHDEEALRRQVARRRCGGPRERLQNPPPHRAARVRRRW